MALNHTNSLTMKSIKKGTLSKLALGAASLMMVAVIGSATMAGATEVEGTTKAEGSTSLQKGDDQDRNKDNKKGNEKDGQKEHQNHGDKEKEHGKNHGQNGYGGGNNNDVKTDLTINQSGHDNVLTVIFNYIFG